MGTAPLGRLFKVAEPNSADRFILKVIPRKVLGTGTRLLEETRRSTRIYGAANAALLQVEETDTELSLLLQWPAGRHLGHLLANGEPIERGQLLDWARQLSGQLAEAHAARVLHRSIAPPAIWIADNQAVLVGFSLAAIAFQGKQYRPPEAAESTPLDPAHSERGDLYSLAGVLLAAARRAGIELAAADPLRTALETCLAPDPSQRWADAAMLERALRAAPDVAATGEAASVPTEPPGGVSEIRPAGPVPTPAPAAAIPPVSTAATPAVVTTVDTAEIPRPKNLEAPPTQPPTAPTAARRRPWAAALIAATLAVAALWFAGRFADSRSSSEEDRPSSAQPSAPLASPVPTTLASASAADLSAATVGREEPPEDEALTLARTLIDGSAEELFGGAAEDEALARELGEDLASLEFDDDARGNERAGSLFGENPITQANNPLLEPAIRQRWLAQAIRNVGDRTALEHLTAEAEKLREGNVTLAEWYEHVNGCKEVCNLVVLGLLQEHIRQVQKLPHTLLLFDVGAGGMSPAERAKLESFLTAEAAPDQRLLLLGRSSRSGNRARNRELSRQRVERVRQAVADLGVAEDRVETIWLGYEPPQLTARLAERYGFDPALGEQRLNQSVLVVAH